MSLNIYYLISAYGETILKDAMQKHIEILSKFGNVLTAHLDSDISQIIDEANVVVADITNPSLEVDSMIAEAKARKIPILCVCYVNDHSKLPAIINECPEITKAFYTDTVQYRRIVSNFMTSNYKNFIERRITFKPNKIFISGPPGSGKSTIGSRLATEYNTVHISTGDLLREIVRVGTHPMSETINGLMTRGELVPPHIMNSIVVGRLNEPDCLMYGYVLDTYPPSFGDLLNLRAADIHPDVVFCFECSDETAIRRQCSRAERVTDNEEKARKRLQVFHAGIPDFDTLSKVWYPADESSRVRYPNNLMVKIDAENDVDIVWQKVNSVVRNILNDRSSVNTKCRE